jgi:hypothetical protein
MQQLEPRRQQKCRYLNLSVEMAARRVTLSAQIDGTIRADQPSIPHHFLPRNRKRRPARISTRPRSISFATCGWFSINQRLLAIPSSPIANHGIEAEPGEGIFVVLHVGFKKVVIVLSE